MNDTPTQASEEFPPELSPWFALVASQLPAILWSVDRDLRFTFGCGAGLAALGLKPNQHIGVSLYEFLNTQDDSHPAISNHLRAIHGETVSYFDKLQDCSYQVQLEPLRDGEGEVIGCVGAALDITQLKRVEESLQQSEERFSRYFQLSPAAMVISSLIDGKIRDCNESFLRLCGRSKEELENATPLDLGLWAEPAQREQMVATIREHGRVRDLECSFYNAARELRIGSVSAELVEFDGVPCLLVSAVDVTERNRATAEIVETNQLLESHVAERTRELSDTNQRLLEEIERRVGVEESLRREQSLLRRLLDLQDRERKLFAYDIHDGILQDMAGARMLIESASYKLTKAGVVDETSDLAAGLESLDKAIREGRRLMSELRPMIIDDHGVVAAINFLVAELAEEGNLQVQFDARVEFERLAPLLEGTLFRIVQESLANTRRHSQASQVRVSLYEKQDLIALRISDNGVGFDIAAVPKDRFGLISIVERARLFGGKARIKTQPGQGTQIKVDLPRQFNLED